LSDDLVLDIATGNVLGQCFRRHGSVEFLDFLKEIDTAVSADLDLHLTPTHASWLNQIEPGFATTDQALARIPASRNRKQLSGSSLPMITKQPKPFQWIKWVDQILASIARFAGSTLAVHAPAAYKRSQ
jgi:hypothetical protein